MIECVEHCMCEIQASSISSLSLYELNLDSLANNSRLLISIRTHQTHVMRTSLDPTVSSITIPTFIMRLRLRFWSNDQRFVMTTTSWIVIVSSCSSRSSSSCSSTSWIASESRGASKGSIGIVGIGGRG